MVDGVSYMHVKDGGVHVVATTRDNVSPSFVLEFLRRICTIIKDYCGHLSEESIRKNFVLIYELLDEAVDYGVPQASCSPSNLHMCKEKAWCCRINNAAGPNNRDSGWQSHGVAF
jgi:hypothetical protein